jgi:hypothetical protein
MTKKRNDSYRGVGAPRRVCLGATRAPDEELIHWADPLMCIGLC